MKVIGFANKFYTLWEVTSEKRFLGNGHSYLVTHYQYIKNISYDHDTALAAYPDAEFDESLHGHTHSWESTKEVWDNVDTFRFGKYQYMKIGDFDLSYLAWYWDNIYDEAHKAYVENILINNGYVIEHNHGHSAILSPSEVEERNQAEKKFQQELDLISSSLILYLTPMQNVRSDGYYRDGDLVYHFQEVKENYYAGTYYYLPVLNGKAKRIKNKTLKITNFTYNINKQLNDIEIEVLDFEIIK